MTDFDDLPFFTVPADMPTIGAKPRPCHHDFDETGHCRHCTKPYDFAARRRGRLNKNRGNRTSRDLADYLGGRCVEGSRLPHDVEACGSEIQSKREANRPSPARIAALIRYIPFRSDRLRCLFWVGARQRLASGLIFAELREWTEWRGWDLPTDARLFLAGSVPVIEVGLPTFRDVAANAALTREED